MNEADTGQKSKLRFHFARSGAFRVVYAEGVFGGVSPKGVIRMSFFNERQPVPDEIVHDVVENGGVIAIGPEIAASRVVKAGIFRELEVDVVMNIETATVVHEWLGKKLEEVKRIEEMKSRLKQEKAEEKC